MEVIHYPHPGLLAPTRDISPGEFPDLQDRIDEMFDLMYKSQGVGLAAPQVNWNARLCIVNPTGEKADELVLINPKIKEPQGKVVGEEGCLSFPGIYAKVVRAENIVVQYLNENMEPRTLECDDILARIIQHEVDHLENILLVHRMSQADRFKNRKKLKELRTVLSN